MQLRPDSVYEGSGKVVEAVNYINANSDLTAYGWQAVAGLPVGAVGVSMRFESMDSLLSSQTALVEDAGYMEIAQSTGDVGRAGSGLDYGRNSCLRRYASRSL